MISFDSPQNRPSDTLAAIHVIRWYQGIRKRRAFSARLFERHPLSVLHFNVPRQQSAQLARSPSKAAVLLE
jgi:hypothetical protein